MKNVRVKPWELEAATSLGRVEAMTEVARKMLADGMQFDEIRKYTGLNLHDLEKRSLEFGTFEEFDKDCSSKCSCGTSKNAHEEDQRPDWYEDDDSWRYEDDDVEDEASETSASGSGNESGGCTADVSASFPAPAPKDVPIEERVINEELRLHLLGWRVARHKEANVPIYMIMHNKTLLEIAALVPKTKEEFMAVKGFGAMKWEKYGEELMKITSEY